MNIYNICTYLIYDYKCYLFHLEIVEEHVVVALSNTKSIIGYLFKVRKGMQCTWESIQGYKLFIKFLVSRKYTLYTWYKTCWYKLYLSNKSIFFYSKLKLHWTFLFRSKLPYITLLLKALLQLSITNTHFEPKKKHIDFPVVFENAITEITKQCNTN